MDEIRQAVILAAGENKRMQDICGEKPKSLLKYKNETILERLIRQNICYLILNTKPTYNSSCLRRPSFSSP